jgi:hypothetical protein
MWFVEAGSCEERKEFLDGYAGVADQGAEGADGEFLVFGMERLMRTPGRDRTT